MCEVKSTLLYLCGAPRDGLLSTNRLRATCNVLRIVLWALGELFVHVFVTLGRATHWVRTRRYDTDAKAGAAQHVAALGAWLAARRPKDMGPKT